MYTIDSRDTVTQRTDVPQSSVGSPSPAALSGERLLHLAYYLEERQNGRHGPGVPPVDEHSQGELCALVRFSRAIAHMSGPPNDEAFKGHPLAQRGLKPYAVSEVANSSSLRTLERMNAVHPLHRPERFAKYKHFVFTFHDSVFECIAENFQLSVHKGSVSSVLRASRPER